MAVPIRRTNGPRTTAILSSGWARRIKKGGAVALAGGILGRACRQAEGMTVSHRTTRAFEKTPAVFPPTLLLMNAALRKDGFLNLIYLSLAGWRRAPYHLSSGWGFYDRYRKD